MSFLRRPHLLVAALAAVVLVTAVAPDASAWLPNARRYHAGRAITLDTDLTSRSGLSAWAIDEYLQRRTSLPLLGGAFIDAEREHGVNARFLLAAAMHESAWGTSSISLAKHNLFGYNAYDRDPGRYASAFGSYAAGIDAVASFMKEAYLTPGGRWYGGRPTLRSMQRFWSSSGRWGESVSRIASSMRLGTLRKRGVRMMPPSVSGLVHSGERVTVQVGWRGEPLPAAIGFGATWTPVSVDHAPDPAPAGDATGAADAGTPLPKAVTVKARELRTRSRTVTLEVEAPATPGTYRLVVTLLDAGGRSLPSSDRPAVPGIAMRVWAERAVAFDLRSTPDGHGMTLRVTNTGTEPVPAVPDWGISAPEDPEVMAVRSQVTLIATSGDPAAPAPVVLLARPLAKDLAPGASLVFHVRNIQAATGRRADWLSVDLRVLDDPAWLAPYSPMGARRSGSRLGTLLPETPADVVPTAGEGGQWEGSIPLEPPVLAPTPAAAAPAAPAPEPTATPMPTPRATVAPTVTPLPAALPTPLIPATASAIATPQPTPPAARVTVPPAPTPQPVAARKTRSVTRAYSEDSRRIRYTGGWRDASGGGYTGGGVAWSTTPGAIASFTFTGRSVQWIGPVGPTRGRALVRIDGKVVATVSMLSSTFEARRLLFHKTFKATGRHTLSITVLSSPGHPYVAIDGFVIRT